MELRMFIKDTVLDNKKFCKFDIVIYNTRNDERTSVISFIKNIKISKRDRLNKDKTFYNFNTSYCNDIIEIDETSYYLNYRYWFVHRNKVISNTVFIADVDIYQLAHELNNRGIDKGLDSADEVLYDVVNNCLYERIRSF